MLFMSFQSFKYQNTIHPILFKFMISTSIPPTISNAQITNVDDQGFTVTCHVSDVGSGIKNVLFPTWTIENDQDDLVWYTATISGNTATRRILYSDHNNERGNYSVHIYAYDQFENSAFYPLTAIVEKNIGCSYQTHIQNIGWQNWAKNGANAGLSYRLEAIEIQVVPADSAAPGATLKAFTTSAN